ncbi:copper chaperone PCu(A)C [Novosphingobium sp. M1R2S20]|uniref:Copper chaperone PCu(A)C n=1 Tax=Novosphingobium rhizovicinum TaxID=3228928 RepID=A0ABV3RBP1_9SPHN
MKIRRPLMLTIVAAAAASLAACNSSETPPTGESTSTIAADEASSAMGPEAKPGVSAAEGRLVLPLVQGRPGVAYFKVRNTGEAPVSLAGVHLAGVGKVEMHRTDGGKMAPVDQVEIAPGAEIAFEPGGLHVMAFDVSDTLKAGGETEMTLTFADGDKLSMPIAVEARNPDAEMAH